MKLTNHMIALDFEHKKDYFPKEMGITVINNDFSVGETYHYYITDERVSNNSHNDSCLIYTVLEKLLIIVFIKRK